METNLFREHERNSADFLKEILNKEGFRLTSQRQKILELFNAEGGEHHLCAEEIHQKLAEQGEKISVSTVYRALHVMVNLGLLQELELAEERKYYELRSPVLHQHHHLVCVHCGEVNEFEDAIITQVSGHETQERGFSLLNSQFTVYGICPRCQGRYIN
ncbi:MAG: transcriptional repressor [Leptolyngbyaceae cyanobacterium SM2_5_2]|nr:transcriptional repressor [Leptolyngbyaceae cyanobacterium SM2_5_2]